MGFAQVGNILEKKVFASVDDNSAKRFTLAPHKLYLDSCPLYHSAFVCNILSDVKTTDTVLKGNCNTGVSMFKERGLWTLELLA